MFSMQQAKRFCVGLLVSALLAGRVMAAGPQSLAGSEWRPVEIAGIDYADDVPLFVRFESDGKVVGHGGCNRFFGSYSIDRVNLRVGPLGATRMQCVAEVMKRETAFIAALQNSRLFLRDSIKLTLKNAQGLTTVRLKQTDWD